MTDTPPKQSDDDAVNTVPPEATEPPNSTDLPETSADTVVTEESANAEDVLLQQVLEYKAVAQRATADYRNLQRDTEERLSAMRKFSTEQLLVELCPLVDYFDSAFVAIPEEHKKAPWLQGVKHIQTYLMQILKTNGVERMITVGQPFNPEFHESVGEEESDQPEHTIIKELQAGFTLQGKAIRPARVVIAKAKAAAAPTATVAPAAVATPEVAETPTQIAAEPSNK